MATMELQSTTIVLVRQRDATLSYDGWYIRVEYSPGDKLRVLTDAVRAEQPQLRGTTMITWNLMKVQHIRCSSLNVSLFDIITDHAASTKSWRYIR